MEAAARDAFFFLEGEPVMPLGRVWHGVMEPILDCLHQSPASRESTMSPPSETRPRPPHLAAASAPFSAAQFPGYEPRRGYSDDGFPVSRAVTYRLAFHPPRDA